jgi:hypothetical protein
MTDPFVVEVHMLTLQNESDRARVMRECNEKTANFMRGELFLHVGGYGWINARCVADVMSTFDHVLTLLR